MNSSSPWLQGAPGRLIAHGVSSWAHGEQVHTFWRWDSCRYGHEQDMQGLLDWQGQPRELLREAAEMNRILAELEGLDLPPVTRRVALVFDWQNMWGTYGYYGESYYGGG